MNKSWNDRADKDLFFTILSVKNIGVISGLEWKTIGSQMRSLGYGFTNEGCRQHFQGLRRAQSKAEAEAEAKAKEAQASGETLEDGTFKAVDPTLNPITRRPGPGRGRSRKHSLPSESSTPTQDQTSVPGPVPVPGPTLAVSQPPTTPQKPLVTADRPLAAAPVPFHTPTQSTPIKQQPVSSPPMNMSASAMMSAPTQDPVSVSMPMPMPMPMPMSMQTSDQLELASNGDDVDSDELEHEHEAKRPRLGDSPQDEVLDEDTVLGLNGPVNYPSPTFNYAEA